MKHQTYLATGHPPLHDLPGGHFYAAGNQKARPPQGEHAQKRQETGGMPCAAGSPPDANGTGPGAGLRSNTQ